MLFMSSHPMIHSQKNESVQHSATSATTGTIWSNPHEKSYQELGLECLH